MEKTIKSKETKLLLPIDLIKGYFLGAVFGIASLIPWVIVAQIGFYASFLGFVIGIATHKGFTLGAGRESRAIIPLLLAVIIFGIPAAEFVNLLVDFNNYGVPLDIAISVIFNNFGSVLKDMIPNILLGYLFAFLGSVRFFRS